MPLLETLRCEDSSDMRQQEREARIVLAKLLKDAADLIEEQTAEIVRLNHMLAAVRRAASGDL